MGIVPSRNTGKASCIIDEINEKFANLNFYPDLGMGS